MDIKVNDCTSCPFGWDNIEYGGEYCNDSYSSGCSMAHRTRNSKQIDYIPDWCPMKDEPIVVSLNKD
jgi:hypothetical protein